MGNQVKEDLNDFTVETTLIARTCSCYLRQMLESAFSINLGTSLAVCASAACADAWPVLRYL